MFPSLNMEHTFVTAYRSCDRLSLHFPGPAWERGNMGTGGQETCGPSSSAGGCFFQPRSPSTAEITVKTGNFARKGYFYFPVFS